jgi:hypothetical protein
MGFWTLLSFLPDGSPEDRELQPKILELAGEGPRLCLDSERCYTFDWSPADGEL